MAYVGRGIDNISNASILDDITFTDSAGPYNLTQNSGADAFTPVSTQALVIQVDGVIQDPTTYTISAATITFDSVMAATSTNNFIVHNGVGLIVDPSDGSVSTATIEDLAVTAGKLAATQDLSTKTITLPASVSGLGTGITNAQLAGSITDAKITGLSSSKLTGALPAISGASLTSLNATNIGSGTVPTARLGTGSASSSVFLAGDNTWAEAGGGKILQITQGIKEDIQTVSSNSPTFAAFDLTATITPSATSSKILIHSGAIFSSSSLQRAFLKMMVDVAGAGYNDLPLIADAASSRIVANLFQETTGTQAFTTGFTYLHSPSTTSALNYKWYGSSEGSGQSMYINRSATDADNNSYARATSTIVLMEVGV